MIYKKYSDGTCELSFPEEFKRECMLLYPHYNDWPYIWQNKRIVDQEIAEICLQTLEDRLSTNKKLDRWEVVAVYRKNSPQKFKKWISDLEAKEKLYRWFLELKQ